MNHRALARNHLTEFNQLPGLIRIVLHTYTYTPKHTHPNTHTPTHPHTHTPTHRKTHAHAHAHARTHTHAHTHTHTRTVPYKDASSCFLFWQIM